MGEEAGRAEVERRLVERSLEDEALRRRLLADPTIHRSTWTGEFRAKNRLPLAIVEARSMEPFVAIRMEWGEIFEIEAHHAVTGEEGMEMLRQALSEGVVMGEGNATAVKAVRGTGISAPPQAYPNSGGKAIMTIAAHAA